MAIDLPWLNNLLPASFANELDVAPTGYYFYFHNMNLAAMHFITTLIFVILLVLAYCLLSDNKANEVRINNQKKTMVNLKFKAFK